uniref:recombinase family protein n=1 Tax=Gudongella sp. DL1XJH-153 TaxID=3409804 RepID=UPI003BB79AA5
GILSPAKKDKWNAGTIKRILTNEKYKGDALLQKSYTVDFLTKKKKANEGEIPQYYVENNHEAIIEPAVFDLVQNELEKRNPANNRHSGVHIFSGKIKCGACGSWYGSKVWHSNSKYRRTVWQCNHKFNGQQKCSTPHLDEDTIKELFVKATNKLLEDKDEIIANFESMKDILYDTGPLETKQAELQNEMEIVTELIQQCINENANVALDQGEYQRRYDGLVQRFDTTKEDLENVSGQIKEKVTRRQTMTAFLDELKKQDELLTDFDPLLWHSMIEHVTVNSADDMNFVFKNGTEINI